MLAEVAAVEMEEAVAAEGLGVEETAAVELAAVDLEI